MDWEQIKRMSDVELDKELKEMLRKVNYRVSRLGKSKKESAAFKKLESKYYGTDFMDKTRTKFVLQGDRLDRRSYLFYLNQFMESKTSTKSGMKSVQAKRRKWVRDTFGGFRSNSEADEFLKFLGRPEIQEQKRVFDSNIVVEALALANKNAEKSLLEQFEEFKKSGKSYGGWIIATEDELEKRGIKF